MPFHVRIAITGVCAVVPDRPLKDNPLQVLVVMPDGRSDTVTLPDRPAQDLTPLRRHKPLVTFKLRDLDPPTALSEDMEGIWYIDDSRLTFTFRGANNGFQVGDVDHLAHMEAVATKDYATIDPNAITMPPTARVAAQVFFNTGKVSVEEICGDWVFPNTLSGAEKVYGKFGTELVVTYTDLEAFSLVATPFAGYPARELPFKGKDRTWVKLTIANLCDMNPLRWYTEYGSLPDDEDFKWYFELLSPEAKEKLSGARKGLPLPVPHMATQMNGQGMNCIPVEMNR